MVFDNDRYLGKSLIELGEFAEAQAELFDSIVKPESVVVEVGANIGAHTVVLAKKAKAVFAFEPQRMVYNVLCGNLALNGITNVETYRVAGGDVRGRVGIPALDFNAEDNNFGAFYMGSEGDKVDYVDVLPINVPCDFMKVDVEGWEAKVLRGSAKMIRDKKPVLYVENDRTENSDELIALVNELGYRAYWHSTPLYREDNHNGAREDPFAGIVSLDMLCLPEGAPLEKLPEAKVGKPHFQVVTQ